MRINTHYWATVCTQRDTPPIKYLAELRALPEGPYILGCFFAAVTLLRGVVRTAAKGGTLLAQQSAIDRQMMVLSEQTEINRRAEVAAKAWRRAEIAFQRTDALIASSRTLLAKSRQLLAELEHTDALRRPRRVSLPESVVVSRSEGTLAGPAVHQSDQPSAQHTELSIRVFEDGEQFGWTVYGPTKEMLGRGTAESEFSARVDALHAGMTYIDRLKGRSALINTRLH